MTLMRALEDGARRRQGRLAAGRDPHALGRALRRASAARAQRQAHEARWLNLCGFLLRPGFGHELDDWRIQQLWKLYSQGLRFPRAAQCRVEWWNLWKRIAGGLSRAQQQELFNQIAPYLLPRLKAQAEGAAPRSDRRSCASTGSCWRAASACAPRRRPSSAPRCCRRSRRARRPTRRSGRSAGSARARRSPDRSTASCARADRRAVGRGAARGATGRAPERSVFALVQLARCVGDRERDLDEALRRAARGAPARAAARRARRAAGHRGRAARGPGARAHPRRVAARRPDPETVARGGTRQRAGARCSHSIVRDRREHFPPSLPLGRRRAGGPCSRQIDCRDRRRSAGACPLGARQRAGARCSHSIVRDVASIPPPSGRRASAVRQTIAHRDADGTVRSSAGVPARSVRASAPERGALTPSFAIVASIPRRPPGGGGPGGPRSARQLLRGRRWSAGVPARSVRASAPERGALTPSFAIVASIPRRPPGGGGPGGPRSARQLLRGRRWSAGVPARSVRDSAPERGALTPSFAIVASIPRRPPGGGGHGGPRSA